MSAADIRAGRAFVEMYLKTSELAHGLVSAEALVSGFTKRIGSLTHVLAEFTPANIVRNITSVVTKAGDAVATMANTVGDSLVDLGKKSAIAGGAIGGAMLAVSAHFAHAGDSLWVLSQRTGASTQMLSGLGYAARQTGASIDEVEVGLRMMEKTIGDAANGSKEAQAALGKIGLSVNELVNLHPDQQFEKIADGLAGIDDQALQTSAAIDVLGRSGQSLLPLMIGLRGFMVDAARLGLIIKPEQAQMAEQLVDRFQALKEAMFAVVFRAGEALAPMLLDAVRAATDLAIRFRSWVEQNQETVRMIGKIAIGLVGIGAVAAGIGVGFKALGVLIGWVTAAISLFGSAVAAVSTVISTLGIGILIFTKLAALATMFPAVAAGLSAIGSAVAAIVSGGLMAALGFVGAALSTIFFEIILPATVIVGGITAGIVAMAAAAVAGAYAFYKLADPFTSLLPVLKSLLVGFQAVANALLSGDIDGAATMLIQAMKATFLRGTLAVIQMVKNMMERLPGFINSTILTIQGLVSGTTTKIGELFLSMLPAIKLAFTTTTLLARDVFTQLPELAKWCAARIATEFIQSFAGIAKNSTVLLMAFGGTAAAAASEAADKLASIPVAAIPMPEFKLGGDTLVGMTAMADEATKALNKMSTATADALLQTTKKGGSTTPLVKLDPTEIEKYRKRVDDLWHVFSIGAISAEEFDVELAKIRKDLGVTSPVEELRAQIDLLTAAFLDGTISWQEWESQVAAAQHRLLGIDSEPLAEYARKIDLLTAAFDGKVITSQQDFDRAVIQAQRDILGITGPLDDYQKKLDQLRAAFTVTKDVKTFDEAVDKLNRDTFGIANTPLEEYTQKLAKLTLGMEKAPGMAARFREEIAKLKSEFLGLDPTKLETFIAKMKELESAPGLSPADRAAGAAKAKKDFLGLPEDEFAAAEARIEELKAALNSPDLKLRITMEEFDLAKLNALPNSVKEIINRAKTPLQKFAEGIKPAQWALDQGLINKEAFNKEAARVKKDAFETKGRVSVSFSAASLIAQGIGGGGKDTVIAKWDRQYAVEQKHVALLERIEKEIKRDKPGVRFN